MSDKKYRKMISSHLDYIQAQCDFVVSANNRRGLASGEAIEMENESLELFNRVIDQLNKDDYKILRRFSGKSSIKTYLSTVIANTMVDMIRKKRGRDRSKERAAAFGDVGAQLHKLVMREGKTVSEAFEELKNTRGVTVTLEECDEMVRKMKGRRDKNGAFDPETVTTVKEGTMNPGSDEVIVRDRGGTPEDAALNNDSTKKARQVVENILHHLDGKDRLILRMRFPANDDEPPLDLQEIADILNIHKKSAYLRIKRALTKCRVTLEKWGLDFNDLYGP